jgi:hypothetical protein
MQRRRLELKAMRRRVCARESIWGELAFFYSVGREDKAEEEGKKRPITWEINRRQHLFQVGWNGKPNTRIRRLSLSRLRRGLRIAWIYGFTFESLLGM